MKPSIRYFHSPDIPDLDRWRPDDPQCFGYLLQVIIGPKDGLGEESFDFLVCSPKWLEFHYKEDDIVFLRHHILVFRHDFSKVREKVEKLIASIPGNTWEEIGTWLGRYGKWEFEDYQK